MAKRTLVKLEGLEELKANLAALGDEVATKAGREANRKAAVRLQEALYIAAPYMPGVQLKTYTYKSGAIRRTDYGDLRDNIKVRRRVARKEHLVINVVTTGDGFWGYFQEFGTVRQPAYPWFRKTVDATAMSVVEVQMAELRSSIDRRVKRLKLSGKMSVI